jgi:hypothetical protein
MWLQVLCAQVSGTWETVAHTSGPIGPPGSLITPSLEFELKLHAAHIRLYTLLSKALFHFVCAPVATKTNLSDWSSAEVCAERPFFTGMHQLEEVVNHQVKT